MDSAYENYSNEPTPQSLTSAWEYGKEIWSASSTTEAWDSFKKMVDATPVWALVVGVVAAVTVIANPWIVVMAVAAAGLLASMFYTTKYAVRRALIEHDDAPR